MRMGERRVFNVHMFKSKFISSSEESPIIIMSQCISLISGPMLATYKLFSQVHSLKVATNSMNRQSINYNLLGQKTYPPGLRPVK